jgi:hypothetical protein
LKQILAELGDLPTPTSLTRLGGFSIVLVHTTACPFWVGVGWQVSRFSNLPMKGIFTMRFHLKSIVAVFALICSTSPMVGAADLNFTIQQVGSDVVMTGSGSVNTAGLTSNGTAERAGSVNPAFSAFAMGSPSTVTDTFWASLTGTKPAIGTGAFTLASSGTGDSFGLVTLGNGGLYLPPTYVSGAALSGQSTFAGTTLSGLGLTTGNYTWTWGSGANAGSAVMSISAVPEPSTYALAVIATGVMAAVARRRKARKA